MSTRLKIRTYDSIDLGVLLPPPRMLCFHRCFSVVCLLATLRKNLRTDLHEIFRKGWQSAIEQMTQCWWRSGSPSGYRDCFPDSSLLGDTESSINRLRCATLQCRACTNRHRHSNYDVITSLAHDRQLRQTCLGGGMRCPSASSYISRESHVLWSRASVCLSVCPRPHAHTTARTVV